MRKKIILLVGVAILSATYVSAQFTFGVRAGFNLATMYGSDTPKDTKFKPGIQVGVVGDYALSNELSIQPGILFAQQGYQIKEGKAKSRLNLNYIQVPINVQYKMDLGGPSLVLQAGPYLGYGLNGKAKAWDANGNKIDLPNDQSKVEFGSGDGKLNAFDFGLGIGAGLQFDNIQVGLGYNAGLLNLQKDVKIKNEGIVFTVTYLFGK